MVGTKRIVVVVQVENALLIVRVDLSLGGIVPLRGRSAFCGDSEVLVGEHDEGYCAQQWNRGDVGMHKGCLHKAGGICEGKVA